MKRVLMPESFILNVYRLLAHLCQYDLDDYINDVCSSLTAQLQDKEDAIIRRKAFSRYITAPPGSVERETFRVDFLDKAGIHKDWRSEHEGPP